MVKSVKTGGQTTGNKQKKSRCRTKKKFAQNKESTDPRKRKAKGAKGQKKRGGKRRKAFHQ